METVNLIILIPALCVLVFCLACMIEDREE